MNPFRGGGELDRRNFLRTSAAAAAGTSVPVFFGSGVAIPAEGVFLHGVASGDPGPHEGVIWTRVTPTAEAIPGSGAGDRVKVYWQVARDASFRRVVARGSTWTGPGRDHTVKVEVSGLAPNTMHFYRFKAKGEISRVGRFRTFPHSSTMPESLRFGFASCAHIQAGYFSAYRHLAQTDDLRFVLHLGDYIYEVPAQKNAIRGRRHAPLHEAVTLADYRMRHGQYKRDRDLRRVHAAHPFITTWDDHEIANNAWRAGARGHQVEEDGDFMDRKAAALRAYFEWMPLRQPRRPSRIDRMRSFGRLMDLFVLDTRQFRSRPAQRDGSPSAHDPDRTITGDRQMRWLKERLASSNARWKVLGNQVLFTPRVDDLGLRQQLGGWDGHTADRRELLRHVSRERIRNLVVLTGDTHMSWANDVPLDPRAYPVTPASAVEFGVPSISSYNFDDDQGLHPRSARALAREATLRAQNPHIKFVEVDSHGYCIARVNKKRMRVDWHYVSDRTIRFATEKLAHSWKVVDGKNSVRPA